MKRPFNPDKEVCDYCDHIMHAHIQVLRENKDERTWYWDYPAMAAICHDERCLVKRASFSHRADRSEFHPVLEQKMGTLGIIGKRPLMDGNRFPIGNCAEQHAANIFMKQFDVNDLNDLYFSKAMRPRTKEVFDYCDNCKDIFPGL